MPEWLKGADCKSAGLRLRWFESSSAHHFVAMIREPPGSLFLVRDFASGAKTVQFSPVRRSHDVAQFYEITGNSWLRVLLEQQGFRNSSFGQSKLAL